MCVHTEHCRWDGCKYGEEYYCPVWLGLAEPKIKWNWEYGMIEIERPTEEQFLGRRNIAADMECY